MTKEIKQLLRSKKELAKLYKECSIYGSAKKLGIGINTIRRWLDKHKIPRHGRITKIIGKQLWRRKDYRFRMRKTGYMFIKKREWDEERAEHRHFIEEILGRRLTKVECVHHINGQKDDNRLENLLLCESNGVHKKIENQLLHIAFSLVKNGEIIFNREKGKYMIPNSSVPFINLKN